ncbi:putative methionyl-tRNA synthetase [Hordeum vulgare]|nr:putative methionyl-tRNA synthetase [Hordeum vulgare]
MPPRKYTVPRPATIVDSSEPKPRKPMARPTGVSDTGWRVDVQRREAVTTDRRRRLDAKRVRDATASATVDQEEASRAGMMNPHGHKPQAAWRRRHDVASPANLSPPMPP